MKLTSFLTVTVALLLLSQLAASAPSTPTPNIKAMLAKAKAGQTIILPAGTFAAGDLAVPAGVTLRGAGYDKTILNAAAYKNGLIIGKGRGVTISDLCVRNARETGVLVSDAGDVVLSRLKIASNLTGLLVSNVTGGRLENLIIAKNRTGVSLTGNSRTLVANCSFVDNPSIALTVSKANRVAIFNNLFVNSPTALYLTKNNRELTVDYNFTIASFYGKLEGEVSRTTLAGWQRVSSQDAHSLSAPIKFAAAEKENYRVTSTLFWAPNLATTSDWGTSALNGFAAPKTDIEGRKRVGGFDLGAYEISFSVAAKPDGAFDITSDDGVKSAGLYNSAGVNVAMFFQNMPLRKGKHPFWIPARDTQNKPLAAGDYQVRVVESQLTNPYLGLAGNFGKTSNRLDNRSWAEEMFAFDAQDRLYIAQNAFENGMGVRAFDAEYSQPRWMMPGGGGTVGVATDAKYIYYLQSQVAGQFNLRKIALEAGVMGEIAPGIGNRVFSAPFSKSVYGMTQLDGKLYVSDSGAGKIFYASTDDPKFTSSFDVPGASSITADPKTHLIWVIGDKGKILALDPATGALKASSSPVEGAKDIAANNGRLAVLSPTTGKIYLLDATDPADLKILQTIGTGDGPAGAQQPDRFWFQTVPGRTNVTKTHIALNSKGDMAVVDGSRVSFWAADGALKKQGLGFWGQHNYLGKFAGDDDVRIWSISGDYSIKMDSKNKRWMPDTRWLLPEYSYPDRSSRSFFSAGGKNFGVYRVDIADPGKTPDGKIQIAGFDPKVTARAYLVVRLDSKLAVPVSLYYMDSGKKTMVQQHDSNRDGIIDGRDEATEIRRADGSAVNLPQDRYEGLPRFNGDLVFTNPISADTIGVLIKMAGLDATGVYPVFEWDKPQSIANTANGKNAEFISPYDFKTQELSNRAVQIAEMSDGGYASSMWITTSGGAGLANGAGTDIGGFSKDGHLRWIFKLNTVQGSQGVQSIPQYKMVMGMTSTTCDYMVMDEDGLGLGVLSMPQESHWKGMWSDHAQQQQAWVGNDGQPYYILGDYSVNGFHWFAIRGMEKTRHQVVPVKVDATRAGTLAALPELIPEQKAVPPTTKVTIARLQHPFAINGDMKKWRDAGIVPAALVTPETGTADILGPQDCSAVIRLAYEGKDLYVQTIVFDDVATFHQPLERMYQQDGIEMGINSFLEGFKFNVAKTTDKGETVYRNKFVIAAMDRIYSPEQVPRSIKVYDSAKDIEERRYIEAIYGVDLSKSKVIVTEFKLPLTAAVALDGDPNLMKEIAPGKSFWIGFFLNDNDIPGGDVQKYLAWPPTYGTFAVKEAGALATFE